MALHVQTSVSARALRRAAAIATLVLGLGLPSFASAQATPAQPSGGNRDAEARGIFLAGQAAFDEGRFFDALRYFRQAYDLSHRAGLQYNVGLAADRLRLDEDALAAFELFLAEAEASEPRRPDVEARVAILRERVQHAREVEAASHAEASTPPPAAPAGPSAPIEPWIVIGVSGAVAVGGGVLLGLGVNEASVVDGAEPGTPWTQVSGAYDNAQWMTPVGIAALGVGVAGITAGIVWLAVTPSDEDGAPQVRVGPGSVSVTGTF